MKREIKFRAWHTKANKMFSAEEMGQDEMTLAVDGRGFVNVSGQSPRLSQYITEMIPMQYTGLKDKNGKEIYEGDYLSNGGEKHEVFYLDSHACFCIKSESDPKPYTIYEQVTFGPWIVIGNKYENS